MLIALKHHWCSPSEKLTKASEHCFCWRKCCFVRTDFLHSFWWNVTWTRKKLQLCSNIRKKLCSNV